MGYERDTYYFDSNGNRSHSKLNDSVVSVTSVEHDTYGNPSYFASVIDLTGAKSALEFLKNSRSGDEYFAIQDAIRKSSIQSD